MGLTGNRTYVGIGFGAIQAGLFLYEAFRSGSFRRLVVSEVMPEVVAAMQRNEGRFWLNIAHPDRVESVEIGPTEIHNPSLPRSRELLAGAVAEAEEIATAVPSVACYVSDQPGSIHRVIAEGLRLKVHRRGPGAVIYAAENHNHAAEILREKVFQEIPPEERESVGRRVRFLNTVIGKMSGVVSDPEELRRQNLQTVTRDDRRAFLVEVFNRILISKIDFEDNQELSFRRGIEVFQEKADLLPFEEAKLFGHNATHALAAYLAMTAGIPFIADLRRTPVFQFLKKAFTEESGAALTRKHRGVDPLFTKEGYRGYVLDLLDRMTNPLLRDTAERVGRDPGRKLGWDDRLIGTMRLALGQGIEPSRYAVGAAAALTVLDPSLDDLETSAGPILERVWGPGHRDAEEAMRVVESVNHAFPALRRWKAERCLGLPGPRSVKSMD